MDSVVMFDDVLQSGEPPVMIEPAFVMAPEASEWRRAVHVCRRAIRLERIHTDFARRMKIVPRLREKRRHMAGGALPLAIENSFTTLTRSLHLFRNPA